MGQGAALPRVAALDGLRGVAVAGVLLFHGGYLTGGYLGVDLFFVLSGFLITSLLLVESVATGRVGLGGFWARRARRLLPAIGGLMVGIAVYCVVFADPAELAQVRADALATVLYVANWRAVFATQDYWALFQAPSPLQHTWSLAIEEQFYLVWPLVFVGLLVWWRHVAAKAVFVTAVALAVVSGALMVVLYDPASTNRAYYGADTRAAAVLLGAALAAALIAWGPIRGRLGRIGLEIVGLGGVAILAVAWVRLGGQAPRLYRGGFFVLGVASIAVIAAAAHPEAGPVSRVFSFRPLCWLGLVSYGVYLWHWPVYVVVDADRAGLTGWPLLGVRVAITFVIAIVSYFLIEQPIRHGALSARTWKMLTPAFATGVVVVIIGSTLGATPAPPAAGETIGPVSVAVREAKANPEATRVTVVGNSVAYPIAEAMKELTGVPPMVIHDAAVVACSFPSGATAVRHTETGAPDRKDPYRCDDRWEDSIERFQPEIVFFIAQCCASDFLFDGEWLGACDPGYRPLFEQKFRVAVETLRAQGAEVFIATSPFSLRETFSKTARANLDCSNELRRELAPTFGAHLIDLFDWTCPNRRCRLSEGGVELRPDSVHFEGESARWVADWMLEEADRQLGS